MTARICAGADGCKHGWIAVIREQPQSTPRINVHHAFADLLASLGQDAMVAVDMPIGLPDRVGRAGRGPELAARKHLGPRQSSVFSIPSREAIYHEQGPFADWDAALAAHRRASAVALATSDPPRAISIQAFFLFPKIREIDTLVRSDPDLRKRLVESHPELAFWRLNDCKAMALPKKIKGKVNPAGMDERRDLLTRYGIDAEFLMQRPPSGAGADDFLDACAMLVIAERHARGETEPFHGAQRQDSFGIPVAIWA